MFQDYNQLSYELATTSDPSFLKVDEILNQL